MNALQEKTSGCDAQEWRTNRMHWGCPAPRWVGFSKYLIINHFGPKLQSFLAPIQVGLQRQVYHFGPSFCKEYMPRWIRRVTIIFTFWWESWGSFCGEVYCEAVSPISTCFQVISSRSCMCGDKFGCNLKQVDSFHSLAVFDERKLQFSLFYFL